MNTNWSRRLEMVGLVLMVGGVIDPLEGSVVILAGTLLSTLGAFLSRTRYRLPLVAFTTTAVGVAALFALSAIGGVGGTSGRSIWWLLLCVPYPVGWILGIVGAGRNLRQPHHSAA
jgi:hypothetical protein